MLEQSLQQLGLETIIEGCCAEANRPREQESGYCFELFRRALEDHNQAAWTAIDQQYKNLILHWIYCCAPALPREAAEEIAPQTLPKFWQILHRSSAPLGERFGHIGAVLKYLKQCTLSVLRDYERRMQRRERINQQLRSTEQPITHQFESEQELLARIDRDRLLDLVRRWVETYVTDPQEQQVLALSFEGGLTPAQIAARYPAEFEDVQTVRRIKERILKRAKRSLGDLALNDRTPVSQNGSMAMNGEAQSASNGRKGCCD